MIVLKKLTTLVLISAWLMLSILIGDEIFWNAEIGLVVFGLPVALVWSAMTYYTRSTDFMTNSAFCLFCAGLVTLYMGLGNDMGMWLVVTLSVAFAVMMKMMPIRAAGGRDERSDFIESTCTVIA